MTRNRSKRSGGRNRSKGVSKRDLLGGWSKAPITVSPNLAKPWYPYAVQLSGTAGSTAAQIVFTASNIATAILAKAGISPPASGISLRCFSVDFYCISDAASTVPPALTATVYGIPGGQSMVTKGDVGTVAFPAALRYLWPASMRVFPTTSTGANDICAISSSPNDAYYIVVRGVWCVD
jgi:hypothetical protein